MSIILAVGTFLIILNLVIETIVSRVQKKKQWGDYRRVRWVMDDKMQLQRMAFEEAGMGQWTKLTESVPVTEPGQVFGGLRHVDPEQPRLGVKWTTTTGGKMGSDGVSDGNSFSDMEAREMEEELQNRRMRMAQQAEVKQATAYSRPVYTPVPSTRVDSPGQS